MELGFQRVHPVNLMKNVCSKCLKLISTLFSDLPPVLERDCHFLRNAPCCNFVLFITHFNIFCHLEENNGCHTNNYDKCLTDHREKMSTLISLTNQETFFLNVVSMT